MKVVVRRFSVAFGLVLAAACTSARDSAPRAAEAAPDPLESVESKDGDLGALIERVHFSFRESSGVIAGGHRTYEARVRPDGAISFSLAGGSSATISSRIDSVAATPRAFVRDDGDVEIARGDVRERLHNTANGLEQSWSFERPPAAETDIVVHVDVAGYEPAGETNGGHHFRDGASGLLLRYGAATWVDAAGRRTPVPALRDGASLALRVPRALVVSSAFPATLDPVIGPEVAVDTPMPLTAVKAAKPAVSPGPNGTFLVAWDDQRVSGTSVVATHVSAAGVPLDKGIYVGQGGGVEVAFDPTNARWLVVTKSWASRIDANSGQVLDIEPLPLPFGSQNVAVAFDGANFFVLGSTSNSTEHRISATFVDRAGNASTPIDVSTATGVFVRGAACDPTACAVLYTRAGNTELVRVSRAGVILDTSPIALGAGTAFGLESSGSQYLALYGTSTASSSTINARRVSSAGAILDAAPLVLGTAPRPVQVAPRPSWNGTRFTAVWADGLDVFARRVAPDGTSDDAEPITISAHSSAQSSPSVAWSGTQSLVTWVDARTTTTPSIYGARVSATLVNADGDAGVLLSRGPNRQTGPSVGASTSGFLVTWRDERSGAVGLWATRLSSSAAPVGSPVLVSSTATGASIASDGSSYLVVWNEGAALLARRLSVATGEWLDAQPLTVSTTAYRFGYAATAVFDGQNYVVAWTDDRYAGFNGGSDVLAMRISPAGAPLDPNGIVVGVAPGEQYAPSAASDGTTGTLIAWDDDRAARRLWDIHGARLARDGTVLDPSSFIIATAGFEQFLPNVAWNGSEYVVAWIDGRASAGSSARDVYVTRVSAAGKSLDSSGAPLTTQPSFVSAPSVVSMGEGLSSLVVWSSKPGSFATSVTRGSFVRAGTGEVLDPGGAVLVPEAGSAQRPVLAPAGPGKALMVYSRFTSEGAERVVARFIESGKAAGAACTATTECAGRYCTDGLCCSEACDDPCKKCGPGGACVAVVSADDDACPGSCDVTGACKKKNGDVCALATECASGFCADGFCCETACEGACDVCNETRGKCTVVPAGMRGTPSCAPTVCNGFEATCPARCEKDEDCADGSSCDRSTGECVDGAVCIDDHTVRSPNGSKAECRPYRCRAGACITACTSVSECAFPAACDEGGRCVQVDYGGGAGGCAVAPYRMSSPASRGAGALLAVAAALRLRRRRR